MNCEPIGWGGGVGGWGGVGVDVLEESDNFDGTGLLGTW